ncbi:unnamed protein product [Microthlaspi erraticum]|uniref:Uncharacterized protein n=1 Tax=Microthlaspi erraticum TaxID=1685480 RepID=A0A6D2LBA7_9BRAS|nr:unnamed protein product [Microthlaspi erraticum]
MVNRSLDVNKDPFRPIEDSEEMLGPEVPYMSAIGLDRVEAWPVELRNSTGWSSGRSSWSSRWLLPSSFAYPVELLPCAKSLHAPCPICSRMLQKTYFKGPNMHMDLSRKWLCFGRRLSVRTKDDARTAARAPNPNSIEFNT